MDFRLKITSFQNNQTIYVTFLANIKQFDRNAQWRPTYDKMKTHSERALSHIRSLVIPQGAYHDECVIN